jgi:hypothetical protein
MSLKRLFNLVIALTVATGLLSTPFAAPSIAKAQHVAASMDAKVGDMPCCPDDGKASGCDSCPLMALCSMTIPISAPSGASALVPFPTAQSAFAFPDDLLIDGLGARPPDHPPRTDV